MLHETEYRSIYLAIRRFQTPRAIFQVHLPLCATAIIHCKSEVSSTVWIFLMHSELLKQPSYWSSQPHVLKSAIYQMQYNAPGLSTEHIMRFQISQLRKGWFSRFRSSWRVSNSEVIIMPSPREDYWIEAFDKLQWVRRHRSHLDSGS